MPNLFQALNSSEKLRSRFIKFLQQCKKDSDVVGSSISRIKRKCKKKKKKKEKKKKNKYRDFRGNGSDVLLLLKTKTKLVRILRIAIKGRLRNYEREEENTRWREEERNLSWPLRMGSEIWEKGICLVCYSRVCLGI